MLLIAPLKFSVIRHSKVDSSCNRFRHAVRCVRFLSTLTNLDDSWLIPDDLAHCLSSDAPYFRQLRNSVVLLRESLIVEEARAVDHVPEVRCILDRLAVD